MVSTYNNYIGGEWTESETGETFHMVNPANVGDTVGRFQYISAGDIDRAVAAGVEAQTAWAARPAPERGAFLRRAATEVAARRDELAETLTREDGKTLGEAGGEMGRAVDILYYSYYAERVHSFGEEKRAASVPDKNV